MTNVMVVLAEHTKVVAEIENSRKVNGELLLQLNE